MRQAKHASHVGPRLVMIRSSLWFAPSLVITSIAGLALLLVELDRIGGSLLRHRWPRLFAVETEGARSMLSAIASSMATVSGVAFSITMVALALASNQYTSRVMRNFMRDRANQVVLGVFIGVYLYCLLVLRTLSGKELDAVPSLAVFGALVLAVLASGAFIFFVHHICTTMQASTMVQGITRDTLKAIDDVFPQRPDDDADPQPMDASNWHPIPSLKWGYVQTVARDRLVAFACKHDTCVRIERRPGDFASSRCPLLSVAMARPPTDDMVTELNRAFGIDAFRTIEQDPAFGIRQLVDMSLKSLSPGINDTTTAITCLEHIGVILTCFASRTLAPELVRKDGRVRVMTAASPFAVLVGESFDQIIESAEGNTEVLLKTLDVIHHVAQDASKESRRAALRQRIEVLVEIGLRSAKSAAAATAIRKRADEVLRSDE